MKVWLARDVDGGLFMYNIPPKRMDSFFMSEVHDSAKSQWELPEGFLQDDVTWENSPKEYEMIMDIYELKAQIKKGGVK